VPFHVVITGTPQLATSLTAGQGIERSAPQDGRSMRHALQACGGGQDIVE